MARRYHLFARFEMYPDGIWLALGLSALAGILFALPGAVMVYPSYFVPLTRRNFGIIAWAGPLVSISLAGIFLMLSLIFWSNDFWGNAFLLGAFINAFLATLNMLPFWRFDGKKVMDWNKTVWAITIAIPGIPVGFIILSQIGSCLQSYAAP